jgi:hypothetical protein
VGSHRGRKETPTGREILTAAAKAAAAETRPRPNDGSPCVTVAVQIHNMEIAEEQDRIDRRKRLEDAAVRVRAEAGATAPYRP